MEIRLFVTGGTFDKEYNEINGELTFRDTHLPEMLKLGRAKLSIQVEKLMMIDSLDMVEDDQDLILEKCKKAKEKMIVITHGTDRMVETANWLRKRVENKTIVLTGAMIPYTFGSSDGMFNLGSALAFVQTLPYGVYVAMNGRYYDSDNVRKDVETGTFAEIL